MVSNEEIKRMLEAKRKGIDITNEKADTANYKICPNCKTKNPEKAIFCVKCGNKLDKNLNVKCPSCGTYNSKDAKFCVECGETLKKETPAVETVPTETTIPAETDQKTEPPEEASKTVSETPEKSEAAVEKTVSRTGIPSSVPEHGIINQKSAKKTCPSCKGENPRSSKFCVVCGEKFEDAPESESKETAAPIEKPAVEVPEKPVKTSLLDKVEDKEESVQKDSSTKMPEVKVPESFKKIKEDNKTPEIVETKSAEKAVVDKENGEEDVDPVEKIKKAKELLDIGAITTEEFESIKKKYLEKI